MQKVKLGTKVKPLGISRLNCAVGVKCRAILIDEDPRVKYMAYDERIRKNVEVDQELVVQFGLRPYTAYFYLVAKLNTDMNGRVVGDQFEIEYLQLSENLNNDFSDLVCEMGDFNSLAITKVSKKTEKGDFSYLNVKPSTYRELPDEVIARIEELRSNEEAIESMWAMVDYTTSITKETYLTMIQEMSGEQEKPKQIESRQPERRAIAQPRQHVAQITQAAPAPEVPGFGDFDGEFGGSDDFE